MNAVLALPRSRPRTFIASAALLWIAGYLALAPLADALVATLPVVPDSRLAEALRFFLYDTPKVLLLLTGVVMAMGMINSYFTPERTRVMLAGRAEGVGNVMAATLGIVTPFCSCSAVPLFIGFVQAGVPLGITFSFLISAPMVNEVALALLFGLFGWRVAGLYLGLGLLIAIIAGWLIGRARMEAYLEDWVQQMPKSEAAAVDDALSFADRVAAGFASVREIVGKVWPYVIVGIAVGAAIHGYVPAGLHGPADGTRGVVVGAAVGADRHPDVLQCRRHHSRGRGAAVEGCRTGHGARVHDECHRPVAAGDDHPAQGAQAAADRDLHRRGRGRHSGGRFCLQRGAVSTGEVHMSSVIVLGKGCANCRATARLITEVAEARGKTIELEKVEDFQEIARYGILSTPGVVIDGKVMHAGGIPPRDKVESWFA